MIYHLQLIVRIQLVLVTVIALMGHAFVKKVGKDWIVQLWIKMHYSACPIVAAMVRLIWTHKFVTAKQNGVATIARKVCSAKQRQ